MKRKLGLLFLRMARKLGVYDPIGPIIPRPYQTPEGKTLTLRRVKGRYYHSPYEDQMTLSTEQIMQIAKRDITDHVKVAALHDFIVFETFNIGSDKITEGTLYVLANDDKNWI